jgi:hypothetical protein
MKRSEVHGYFQWVYMHPYLVAYTGNGSPLTFAYPVSAHSSMSSIGYKPKGHGRAERASDNHDGM